MSFSGECCAGDKVVLEGGEDVADDRHAPGLAEQTLAATATQVGHIRVVIWETKQPACCVCVGGTGYATRGKVSWMRCENM